MNKIRIVTTRTTGLTHLLADQGESVADLASRAHARRTLCGRSIEGRAGYFDAKHDGTVQFGTKGDCVRCTTQGRAREILPTPAVKAVPQGGPALTGDPLFDPLRKKLDRELVKYLVSQRIFCPRTGDLLDVRTAVVFRDDDQAPVYVMSPRGWVEAVADNPSIAKDAADSGLHVDWSTTSVGKIEPACCPPCSDGEHAGDDKQQGRCDCCSATISPDQLALEV